MKAETEGDRDRQCDKQRDGKGGKCTDRETDFTQSDTQTN